jgi:hypothetical protein
MYWGAGRLRMPQMLSRAEGRICEAYHESSWTAQETQPLIVGKRSKCSLSTIWCREELGNRGFCAPQRLPRQASSALALPEAAQISIAAASSASSAAAAAAAAAAHPPDVSLSTRHPIFTHIYNQNVVHLQCFLVPRSTVRPSRDLWHVYKVGWVVGWDFWALCENTTVFWLVMLLS